MRVNGVNGAPPRAIASREADAVNALARSWDAARGGDNTVSRKDLEHFAGDNPPRHATPELIAAARYLLETQDALDALDTAGKGGETDGKISTADLGMRLRDVPLTDADRSALAQVTTHWNALRGSDDSIGRGDLEKLVGDDPPDYATPELIAAARHLLDHPQLSTYRLDIAQDGSNPDGKISVEDLGHLLAGEYAQGGEFAPEMAAALLATGSGDDAVANADELVAGLERSGFEVDGGGDAMATVVEAFDQDHNLGLGAFELRDALASGALVIDGQVVRIEGLAPVKPGHDNVRPDAANDARIDRPIEQLTAAGAKALTTPADSAGPVAPGQPVDIGGDRVTAATAAYAPGKQATDTPLIVATGASGARYAVDPDAQPNLFASLSGFTPETGNALGKADGAGALHAVPVGGTTLPDGSRHLAASRPLGEHALTALVTRYRDAGDDATPVQQKFLRMLEATQYLNQKTDLGDEFTDPLTQTDAHGIFDGGKVEAGLAEAFADPGIQADYAKLVRDFTPDLTGTTARIFGNLTSTDFSDYVTFLQDSGQHEAAQAQIADGLLGLQELDPDKAQAAAAQLDVNLVDARIRSTDIGDLAEDEVVQATSDVLAQLGLSRQVIGDVTGTLALKGKDLASIKGAIGDTLGALAGNSQAGRAIGGAIKQVLAAGGSVLNFKAVANAISGSVPGQLAGQLRGLVNDLGDAGLWGTTTKAIGATGAIYRMVHNGGKLSTDPWERLTLANELVGTIGGASSYTQLAGSLGKVAGWGDLADGLGLGVSLPDAAKALKAQFDGSSSAAVAAIDVLPATDRTDAGKVEKTLKDAGVRGNTAVMARDIARQYADTAAQVGAQQTAAAVTRNVIRSNATYSTIGPGMREHTLATSLVGVDLRSAADVGAALRGTGVITAPAEIKAISAEIVQAAGGPLGTPARINTVNGVLMQHTPSLTANAVDLDPAATLAGADVTAGRRLAASNTITQLVDGGLATGSLNISVNGKRAVGLAINSLGAVADTTGGVIGLATNIRGIVDGVKAGDPKAIASGGLGLAGSAGGVTSTVLKALRGASLATKVLGPVSILLDVASIFVSIFAGGPSKSEAFANRFDRYGDDGALRDDGKQNAESWYLNHLDREDSTVGS